MPLLVVRVKNRPRVDFRAWAVFMCVLVLLLMTILSGFAYFRHQKLL